MVTIVLVPISLASILNSHAQASLMQLVTLLASPFSKFSTYLLTQLITISKGQLFS